MGHTASKHLYHIASKLKEAVSKLKEAVAPPAGLLYREIMGHIVSKLKDAVAPPSGPCPWLVYYHGEDYKHQTFYYNITGDGPVKTFSKKITALHDKEVLLSSSHGWLVLYDGKTKLLSLCNSTTFHTAVTLPKLDKLSSPYNYTIDSCVLLSSSPNSTLQDLQVVIFFESVSSLMSLRLDCDVPAWREVGYSNQLETLMDEETRRNITKSGPFFFSGAVSCGSKIYAKLELPEDFSHPLIWSVELVQNKEKKKRKRSKKKKELEEVVLSRLGELQPTIRKRRRSLICGKVFLLESYGQLFLLRFTRTGISVDENETIEVYRLKIESVWERVKVVKDTAFFLGNRYCLSCRASGCGSRVYYCMESSYPSLCYRRDHYCMKSEIAYPRLLCYSMEEDREIVPPPLPDLPTPPLSPIWIMPGDPLRPKDDDCTEDDHEEGSYRTTPSELVDENSKSDQDFNAGEKQLLDLPLEVLVQVSKHLVPLDYMNFRATCRVCRSAIPAVKWSNPLSGSENSLAVPFLMCHDIKNDSEYGQHVYEFVDPRLNGKCSSYLVEIPNSIESNVICYSVGGWVLTNMEGGIDLYNAFTGEVISVISYIDSNLGWNHSIFFTTSGHEFVDVVISVFFSDEQVSVSTIIPGEEHWTVDENVFVDLKSKKGFKQEQMGPIFFEDAFYYLDWDGNLGKLEIYVENDEHYKASWEVLEMPLNSCDICPDYFFLVERDGDLLSVFVGSVGKRVSVYKFNQTKMVWETVLSLGNYALYLSQASSISVKTSPDLGNRIYFPWLAFFSLETGEWHFSGCGYSTFNPYHVQKFMTRSTWITPRKDRIIRE